MLWTDESEKSETLKCLSEWSEISLSDCLACLGPQFNEACIVDFAVEHLERQPVKGVISVLPQLIQSLKFSMPDVTVKKSLIEFLIRTAIANEEFGCLFFWLLTVECEVKVYSKLYGNAILFI